MVLNKKYIVAVSLTVLFIILFHDSTLQSQDHFLIWKDQYSVAFESQADDFYRRKIFDANLQKVRLHNANQTNTYKMAMNQFAIFTQEEFQHIYLNPNLGTNALKGELASQKEELKSVVVDWEQKGAVGPVKNQVQTGSVSELVALQAVQGLSKVTTNNLQIFSLQQLTDCIPSSSWIQIDTVYNYYIKNNVCTEKQYPLTPKPSVCKQIKGKFTISGFLVVMDCSTLKHEITKQPIAVIVDASNWALYRSGIFSNCQAYLNHLVLLTGLADEYWRVKNSWGTSWGEKGYMRLAPGNTCGLCNKASFPTR